MLFSVVIPTYNRAAWLGETLDSVFAQTFRDFEVIVVDDGSTDETRQLAAGLGQRVQWLTQSTLGPGEARNTGARAAKGDYLAFLDSDDLWFPWTLEIMAEVLEKYHRPSIVAAKIAGFTDESPLKTISRTPLQTEAFPDYLASHDLPYFVGASPVLKRETFLQTGGYTNRPINMEDHDLILRMGTSTGFVQVTSPATVAWRQHSTSASMNLARNVAGGFFLLEQEQHNAYPGGEPRKWERRKIISRHVRPVSLACLRESAPTNGWQLYRATLNWHLRLRRWKYLLGFPLKALTKT